MDEALTWMLTQGVLGVTTALFAGICYRLWGELEKCRTLNLDLQKQFTAELIAIQKSYAEAQLQTQERVLNAFNANTTAVTNNTDAIRLVLAKVTPT